MECISSLDIFVSDVDR